jgi:hypothetical protein
VTAQPDLIVNFANNLGTNRFIPSGVANLLLAVADTRPTEIAAELDHGRLARMIGSLDMTSRIIAQEAVAALRLGHENRELFEWAAALDLVRERLEDHV